MLTVSSTQCVGRPVPDSIARWVKVKVPLPVMTAGSVVWTVPPQESFHSQPEAPAPTNGIETSAFCHVPGTVVVSVATEANGPLSGQALGTENRLAHWSADALAGGASVARTSRRTNVRIRGLTPPFIGRPIQTCNENLAKPSTTFGSKSDPAPAEISDAAADGVSDSRYGRSWTSTS